MATVELDRAQRDALRRELSVLAHLCTDVELGFDHGDRASVARILARLSDLVVVMDAIGWREDAQAPAHLSLTVDETLAGWAGLAADELATSLGEAGESVDPDSDLDALSALRLIAGES
jgi:hypothetical protein